MCAVIMTQLRQALAAASSAEASTTALQRRRSSLSKMMESLRPAGMMTKRLSMTKAPVAESRAIVAKAEEKGKEEEQAIVPVAAKETSLVQSAVGGGEADGPSAAPPAADPKANKAALSFLSTVKKAADQTTASSEPVSKKKASISAGKTAAEVKESQVLSAIESLIKPDPDAGLSPEEKRRRERQRHSSIFLSMTRRPTMAMAKTGKAEGGEEPQRSVQGSSTGPSLPIRIRAEGRYGSSQDWHGRKGVAEASRGSQGSST